MMDFSNFPKVELHLHLDCSLSYEIVKELDNTITYGQYQRDFIASPKCTNLVDYIACASRAISLMQSKNALQAVTEDLVRQLVDDNVLYAEIRFAPLEHTRQGLSPEEVVQAVLSGLHSEAAHSSISINVILCTLRHYSEEQSMRTVQLVHKFKKTRVVGFDIASDEAGYPVDNHVKAFRFAKDHKIHCTAHAGEAMGAESVWETLKIFSPERIGHGVRSIEDELLISHLKSQGIHLEVCPSSNIQTKTIHSMDEHPIDRLYDSGVSVSINTDARTISNTTLTKEYSLLREHFQWKMEHFIHCNLQAAEHAFLPLSEKQNLKEQLLAAYNLIH